MPGITSATDADIRAAAEAWLEHRSYMGVKRALGLRCSKKAKRWCVLAARVGLIPDPQVFVPPGYQIKERSTRYDADGSIRGQTVTTGREPGEVFQLRAGHRIKGESALLNADGETLAKWVKTTTHGPLPLDDVIAAITDAFDGYAGRAKPLPAPQAPADALLTLVPCSDWHLGMRAWGDETNGEDWDLRIAEQTIFETAQRLLSMSPSSAECVILGGGDLLHADNYANRTAKSGHPLDVDGRWPKVLGVACRLLARIVELAAQQHGHVLVRILPGNHDEQSAIAVSYYLSAHFQRDARVSIDLDPGLFWFYEFGHTMLAATHGHTVKISDMPGVMAGREPEMWGRTSHRYAHGFHVHHKSKTATEGGGVVGETHQTPAPPDAWNYGQGFVTGRSMQTITYHREHGEWARCRLSL